MNIETFEVGSAIVHSVPRGGAEHDELVLTDAAIPLDESLRAYFRTKIVRSLGLRGLDVVVDPEGARCVRDAVAEMLADETTVVDASHRIARHLSEAQTGRNSAGLLAIVHGTVDGSSCISVVKLEREQGLRFSIETDAQGRKTVDLELLRQLTLTDKTKVFKTSLLTVGPDGSADSMFGRVSDDQRGKDDGVGVATFYLSTFLGCTLRTSPEKATLDFVRAAETYFNANVANPEKRGQYQVALLARMQDNVMDIRPRDFAQTHLDVADRTPFVEVVRNTGLDPNVSFEKDTSMVKVNGFKMTFESGMVLVGKRDDLEQRVDIRPDSASTPGVDIKDAVKKLSGR
jgi:hypothetical protein